MEKRFSKFDRLLDEGSIRGETEIKESFYQVFRENDRLIREIRVNEQEYNVKVLKYGEERDVLQRKVNMYSPVLPSEEAYLQAIICDKSEEILMLESSNDQLLKVKKEQEDRILDLEKQTEAAKKEAHALRIKAAELFKVRKDLEESNKKISRYYEMI